MLAFKHSIKRYNYLLKFGLINKQKRKFSTSTGNKGNKKNINWGNTPIIFDSLESGYNETKSKLLGVSGVYMPINAKDPHRFYIGSSNNLARCLALIFFFC